MGELLQLAERCEKAEGPDRATDHAIYEAVIIALGHTITRSDEGFRVEPRGCDYFTTITPAMVLAYTSSLDAALTLVPEGCNWSAESDGSAHVWKGGDYYADISEYGKAATPALALCAAALRARHLASDATTPASSSNRGDVEAVAAATGEG
jgi:hypothetical protein